MRRAVQQLYCSAAQLLDAPLPADKQLVQRAFGWALKALKQQPAPHGVRQLNSLATRALAQNQPSTWGLAWSRGWRRAHFDGRGYEHFEKPPAVRTNLPIIAVGLVGVGGIYYYSCQEEVPYTKRKHSLVFTSQRQEEYLGRQIFSQVQAEAREAHKLLPPNHPAVQLVRNIGMKIAAVAGDGHGGGHFKHMQNLDWEFAVVKEDNVNAFVVPGGKVVVFTGLLDLMQTEDEVAAVLAHEVAHVLARHQAERISSMSVFSLFQMIMYVTLGISIPGFLYQLAFFLPYSRRAETEADVIGLHLMARACYDPTGNPRMLKKLHFMEQQMERKSGMSVPQFLRTHPLSTQRVKEVEKHLPSALHELQTSEHCHHHTQHIWGFLRD